MQRLNLAENPGVQVIKHFLNNLLAVFWKWHPLNLHPVKDLIQLDWKHCKTNTFTPFGILTLTQYIQELASDWEEV